MKKIALLAAATALLTGTQAMAQGYVGAVYNNDSFDSGVEVDVWQGEGAAGFRGQSWGAQIDGSFGNYSNGGGDQDFWALAGHVFYNGEGWRLGGVVATTHIDAGIEDEEIAYGAEGSWDVGPRTVLIGSATGGETTFFGTDFDTWVADVGVRHYITPNIRIGGTLGYGNLEAGGADLDATSIGINGEFQPWSAPISITVGYDHYETDIFDIDVDSFSIGARWNFGAGTLRDRDNAAPFDTRTVFYQRLYGIH
jgi:hypothetical protein